MRIFALVVTMLSVPHAAAAQVRDEPLFQRALTLSEGIVREGCAPLLVGSSDHPFREAPVACDAFLALALASMAEGHPERRAPAAHAIERLLEDALGRRARAAFRSTGNSDVDGRALPRSVLYRGLVLVTAAALEGVGGDHSLVDPLADAVAQDLERSAAGWLPSFGRRIWPCDHAPAAAALLLHAGGRDDARAARWRAAGQATRDRLVTLLDAPRGFTTRIDARGRPLEPLPRGTALAFTAGFLLHADRALAARFAQVLADDFCDSFGPVAACREHPRGVHRRADAASGPITHGYGAGASALGIGASRALAPVRLHTQLVAGADAAGVGRFLAEPERFRLENAIYFWGRTATTLTMR